MKVGYAEYKKIISLTHNEFSRWLNVFGENMYAQGVKDGESELDEASPEQWQNFINATPKAKDIFSIWDYDKLYNALSKEFTVANVDRIMRIICEDDYGDRS